MKYPTVSCPHCKMRQAITGEITEHFCTGCGEPLDGSELTPQKKRAVSHVTVEHNDEQGWHYKYHYGR